MDFVEEDDCGNLRGEVLLRFRYDLGEVLFLACDSGEMVEFSPDLFGDDIGEGGLADARRSPENHRGDPSGSDEAG